MPPLLRRLLPLAAAPWALACSNQGALGNGTFSYQCVPTADAPCTSAASGAIPATVPVGTHFTVTYTANDQSTWPNVTVAAVSTDFIDVDAGAGAGWVTRRPGNAGIYATAGGLALDYTLLRVPAPSTPDAQ